MHPNHRSQGWRHGDNRNNSIHQRNSGGNRWSSSSNDRYYGGGTGNHHYNYNSSSNYNNPSHYGRGNIGQQDAGCAAAGAGAGAGGGWNSEREGRVAESSHKSKRPGDAASSAPVETATAASATTAFFGFDSSNLSQNKRPKTSETADLRLVTTKLPSQPLPPTQDATLEDLFASSCTIGTPPNEEANKAAFVECLREMDRCLDFVSEQAHQLPIGWAEKKQAAAEKTIRDLGSIQRVKSSTQHSQYYDDDDSDDSLPPGCSAPSSTPEIGLSVDEKRFINALPFCIPLSAGFHVLRPDASEICFCPCGPNLTPWREKFNLHFDGICGKHTKKFTPNALMDHLKMEGGCYEAKSQGKMGSIELKDIYHHATRIYLQNLYADYFGKDYDHKALHPCQSKEFQRAVNEEMRLMELAVVLGMRENRKVQEENEKLREENKKLSFLDEDRRNAIERYEELLKRFNVKKRDTTQDALSDHQLAKFKRITSNYFEMNKGLQGTLNDAVVEFELRSMAKGAVGFSLQTFFDERYENYVSRKKYQKKEVNSSSVLFEDEGDGKIAKAILSYWEIIYDKQADYSDSKAKEEDTAVDQGGPSRQFLTDVFKQIEILSVNVGTERVSLFQNTNSGVEVVTDELLEHYISKAAAKTSCVDVAAAAAVKQAKKAAADAVKQAKAYVRAIGRIMLHSMANDFTLPAKAMSRFFMTVMFHGYDETYHRADILNHVGRSITSALLDDDGNELTPESFFSNYIPETFIQSRKILLGSLQDGLTVGGCSSNATTIALQDGCGMARDIFYAVPIQAIRKIYFSKSSITLEDLLAVIVPKYGDEADPHVELTKEEKAKLIANQEIFFNGDFKRYLRESAEEDSKFLVKFVECVTGSNYLPYDGGHITIEFSFTAQGYPKFHTCTREVVIPGYEYYWSDFMNFKEKMNEVIDVSYNQFAMK